jgi:preprotein translocase subunit SecY
MPIIFAQALMFIPGTLASFMPDNSFAQWMGPNLGNPNSWSYNLLFAVMIIVFTYLYTAITINPNQMADDMKRNSGFIPGIQPGKKTAEFIDGVMSKITFPGSVFLAMVAIFPSFAVMMGINSQFAHFYGGTSLLIMVGVILDTLQQIESHLLMRHYDGLMKTGRIQGRSSSSAAAGGALA